MMSTKTNSEKLTRIVATIGPASESPEMIEKLFEAGVNVFRLNFSHGTQQDHGNRLKAIRALEKNTGRNTCIIADLQGPKLRLGTFAAGSIELKKGQGLRLDLSTEPGDNKRVCLPHPEIIGALKVNSHLLLDDGKVKLRITKKGSDFVETEVVAGEKLSDRKGVNVPDVIVPIPALTKKDLSDLEYALKIDADWIAVSFVQRPEDLIEARKFTKNKPIITKVEKPSAIDSLSEIIRLSDGIMVARGDLGVEMSLEDIPYLQKRMVRECRLLGKPVIVATQMFESMITSVIPTRAEVSDVANAVYDGTDAVMLSAETASGNYPLEAVEIMNRIVRRAEQDILEQGFIFALPLQHASSEAIAAAASQVTRNISAACIVAHTASGATALRVARERSNAPVLCLTPSLEVARRLSLSYGVRSVYMSEKDTAEDAVTNAIRFAKEAGLAKKDQSIVITAGEPFGVPGSTNSLRVVQVD